MLPRSTDYHIRRTADPLAGPVIVKGCRATLGPDDLDWLSLQNEHRILKRLQGVPECPRLVRLDTQAMALITADFGGIALSASGLLGTVDLPRFLHLAVALAQAVDAIHDHGVIHKDLNPTNILVRPDDDGIQIIDFGMATTFISEQPLPADAHFLAVTPAYMSPEQTGCMNRAVDYRTDLYSLGATLYALATGSPPFAATDMLALVRAHLAEVPEPPWQRAPWLPRCLGEVILSLLAKDQDERYQSAYGLLCDLRNMARAMAAGQPLAVTALRSNDFPLLPRLPSRLFGRATELARLHSAFADVQRGSQHEMFVSGYSGVGKSALIQELLRPVTLGGGLFFGGKFEQFQSDHPFFAPAQALHQLTHWLSALPEDQQDALRRAMLVALGRDAGALLEVAPELAAVLGPLPAPQALEPIEAQRRLRWQLVELLRVLASPKRPIVLFLDDLQWADQPSLDFIAALLDDERLGGLLFIGAYRDNEVDATHPLSILLQARLGVGHSSRLHLEALDTGHASELIADMLRQSPASIAPFAARVFAKTQGNPYFTIEMTLALFREGALRPDRVRQCWQYDAAALEARTMSANVVDFLMQDLAKTSDIVSDELVLAACLGTSFSLGLLAQASATPAARLVELLQPAMERGVFVSANVLGFERALPQSELHFCHDRMQQAVYQLRDDAWRQRQHLAIGRRLAGADFFLGAMHYLQAGRRIEEECDANERQRICRVFRDAAARAGQVGAFDSAERFLRRAIALLPSADGAHAPDPASALYLELHTALHLVVYSLAQHDEADAIYALLADRVGASLQLVDPARAQLRSLSARTRYDEGIALCADLLERLGHPLPLADPLSSLQEELDGLYHQVASEALNGLIDAAPLDDPAAQAIAKLQNSMIATAFFSQPLLACWLAVRLARRWLAGGYYHHFLHGAACTTLATILLRDDYATGYRIARMALEIGARRSDGVEVARCEHVFALFNCHWFEPLTNTLGYARQGLTRLIRAGELEYACYIYYSSQAALLDSCTSLGQFEDEVATALEMTCKAGNLHASHAFLAFRQLARALNGETRARGSFDAQDFSEAQHLAEIASNPMARAFFHIYRALSALLFEDRAALIHHAEIAASLTDYIVGFYPTALARLLHSIALLESLNEGHEERRAEHLAQIDGNQAWLAARASAAPMNFAHLHRWVEAERLEHLGQPWLAMQQFEQAISQAGGQPHGWQLAIITERAGACHLRNGLTTGGRHFLRLAHDRYLQWGATGKAAAMRAAHPFIDVQASSSRRYATSIEHEALLRASQALAAEVSLDGLTDRLVAVIGQLTGATDVRLLVREEGQWWLQGGLRDARRLTRMSMTDAMEKQLLPSKSDYLLSQIHAPVIIDNAVMDSRLGADSYFAALPNCSVLLLPIHIHGKLSAVLALENRLCTAAFTPQRIETVSLLCAQLSISLENSRLYASLESKVAERTRELAEANAKLQALSELDGLTGIANRRKFDLVWKSELHRAARHQMPLAVALIDIDYFKAYNDHYGHQSGDQCLRRVAQALAVGANRSSDLVARYGGEEFVVVLPGITESEATHVAERLRKAVEDCRIPHAKNGAAPVVTISVGVASRVPTNLIEPEELLSAADAMLYRAKRMGRNRVVSSLAQS